MKTAEYLDAAKEKLRIKSDYELAQRLDFLKQDVSRWRKGKIGLNAYAAVKIAITLGIDPAIIIAETAMEHEKNPKKVDFWTGFISRVAQTPTVSNTRESITSAGAENAPEKTSGEKLNGIRIMWSYENKKITQCEKQKTPLAVRQSRGMFNGLCPTSPGTAGSVFVMRRSRAFAA